MQIKNAVYKIKGMRRDDSYSSFNPEYSWDNKNIRLTARDNNDLLSITNEIGTLKLTLNDATPEKVVIYTYSYSFENYLGEQTPTIYTNTITFENFLIEQSDGWTTPTQYSYQIEFNNYLIEQEQI